MAIPEINPSLPVNIWHCQGDYLPHIGYWGQFMNETKYVKHEVTQTFLEKWQSLANLMAKIFDVPSGLIMRVLPGEIEVLTSSQSEVNNPYEPSEKASLNTGLYCEKVLSTRKELSVPNALEDERWKNNPDIKFDMISYLGMPLIWPNGEIFGTICVLDSRERTYSKMYRDLLVEFKDMIEVDFLCIVQNKKLNDHLSKLEEKLKIGTLSLKNERKEAKLKGDKLKIYERIVSSTNDMMAFIDIDYIYQLVNHTYLEVHGKTKQEIEGKKVVEILGEDIFNNIVKPRLDFCMAGGEINYQEWFDFSVAGHCYMQVSYFPYTVNKDVKGVVVRLCDITETKKLNEQLLQSQKMESLGLLAGGLAHNFNNVLMAIMGSVELSRYSLMENDPLQNNLKQIMKASQHAANIVRQLLAFARKQTIFPEVLNLNEAVDSTLALMQQLIGEDITLEWKPTTDIWNIKIDPQQINQIITNLCMNAREAIVDIGEVEIKTGNVSFDEADIRQNPKLIPGDFVVLTIKDSGSGITPEVMGNIFDPFFTTRNLGEGTGLGLPTVYGIVKQNNGFIIVDSEEGKGTEFKIYLARDFRESVTAEEPDDTDLPMGSRDKVIMLVEDDRLILRQTHKMLEMHGYSVLPANTPKSAVEMAAKYQGNIDLLITDVIMPKMNGRDLSLQLKALYPHISIIFMSGYATSVIGQRGIPISEANFIQKPFLFKDLANLIGRSIDGGAK